ncbi:MAG: hypothetical protein M1821_001336 [Bathelium mastoideum]|nr:MAG: hypothetical protein M1821_001336 [Bathelium mastoideum]KAI9689861.1 MAG: hypothetical protein M1822_009743 [Bathelium mastoideum]
MPATRPWAYRVENIPAGTTQETLLEHFAPEDRPHIHVRSLASSTSHYARGQSSTEETSKHGKLTATISFTKEGASEHGPKLRLSRSLIHRLTVDRNFYGFTPLNQPFKPDVDIIAVTGLAGHAYGSWATRDDYMWLRDDLPVDIESARILLYGYPSELLNSKMKRYVMDHATDFLQRLRAMRASNKATGRPIILIGHSLGCLVIKQALIDDAEMESKANRLPIACIVFLGAPHRGLDVKNLETLVYAKPPEDLVRELKPGSPTLRSLSDRFPRVINRVPIISCYEKLPTPTVQQDPDGSWTRTGPEAMMVSEDSARLYLPNEISISANSNHSDIAKINPGESGIYPIIGHYIRLALSPFHDQAALSDYQSSSHSQATRPNLPIFDSLTKEPKVQRRLPSDALSDYDKIDHFWQTEEAPPQPWLHSASGSSGRAKWSEGSPMSWIGASPVKEAKGSPMSWTASPLHAAAGIKISTSEEQRTPARNQTATIKRSRSKVGDSRSDSTALAATLAAVVGTDAVPYRCPVPACNDSQNFADLIDLEGHLAGHGTLEGVLLRCPIHGCYRHDHLYEPLGGRSRNFGLMAENVRNGHLEGK